MGTEMKTPENCDSSLRNRKKKENVAEKSEKSVKNLCKTSEKMETDVSSKMEQQQEEKFLNNKLKSDLKSQSDDSTTTSEQFAQSDSSFRIRLEFDPMSIALLTLAIISRFFKLSEPRNVV